VTSKNCGNLRESLTIFTACSNYLNNFTYNTALTNIKSWAYNVTQGYNQIFLQNPYQVQRGQFLMLNQLTALIAIDTTENSKFSDLMWIKN